MYGESVQSVLQNVASFALSLIPSQRLDLRSPDSMNISFLQAASSHFQSCSYQEYHSKCQADM